MKILFEIGGVPVTLYGVLVSAAILAFWLTGFLWLKKRQTGNGTCVCWMTCTALFGWLVSRIAFVLCNAAYYIDELDGCWAPVTDVLGGGYSMIGMLLGAVLGAAISALICRGKLQDLLNAVGFGAPLSILILRVSEFLCDTAESGDIGEGKYLEGIDWLDSLLERMGLLMQADGDMVYPACLAQAAVVFIILIVILIWVLRRGWSVPCADVLTVFLMLYGSAQLVLEQLRDDGHLVFHFVHIQQVLALVLCVAVLIIWTKRYLNAGTKGRSLPIVWIVALVCIGVAVWACFGIDRWENKFLAWSLLVVPVMIQMGFGLYLRSAANYLTGEA